DPCFEVFAREIFRDQVTPAVLRSANVVDRHDTRVVETGQQTRLRQERLGIRRGYDPASGWQLDGDFTPQLFIVALVHDPKATGTQFSRDEVASQAVPWFAWPGP